ncbi:hypothetical protein DFJ74DRAFT_708628 [Hyaloraphidium curvatum]|nr:hypothetical protein DFJ74DRAFT_708628 [Hyaloraphidium curvatum]
MQHSALHPLLLDAACDPVWNPGFAAKFFTEETRDYILRGLCRNGSFLGQKEQADGFRYAVSVDGFGAAFRSFQVLSSGMTPLLPSDNQFEEHFYGLLKPWYHFVPTETWRLHEAVEYLRRHDAAARRIALRAMQFAKRNLRLRPTLLFPLGTRLLGTFFLVVTAFVAARRLFSAGPDNVDLPDHNVDEPYYTYLEDGSILLTLQNGKTMRIEVRGKDEQEDTAKAYRHCDAKSGVPEALPFYSLRTAPSLVWNATFEDWLSSNGTVPIRLSWTSTEPEFVGLPGKLLADKLHYFNIRAPGVFTAYLKSETSIVPVFLRPRASEAERLYLSAKTTSRTWV